MTFKLNTTPIRLDHPSVGSLHLPRTDRALADLGEHQPHDARALFREFIARNGERPTLGPDRQPMGAIPQDEVARLADEAVDALIGQYVEHWRARSATADHGAESTATYFVGLVDRAAERAKLRREEWQKTLASLSAPPQTALGDLDALSRTAAQSIANLLRPGWFGSTDAIAGALDGPEIAGALNPQVSINPIDGIEGKINLPELNLPTPEELQRPTTRRLEEIAARQDQTTVAVADLGAALMAAISTAKRAQVIAEESDKRSASSVRRSNLVALLALIVAILTLGVQLWGELRG